MFVLGRLEQSRQVVPAGDVGLDVGEVAVGRRRLHIAANDLGTQRSQELNGSQANTRGAACESLVVVRLWVERSDPCL